MTAIRMALSELRRITAGRLPIMAVAALVLIPVLYAGFYLYANGDPYSRLDHVPAALVVEDAGATDEHAAYQNVGNQVADSLEHSGSFAFHRVTAAEAESGVRDNRYTFALTLPRDFTAALRSSADFTPRQGLLTLTTNDANNYLVHTIANTVVTRVHDSVARQVGTQSADRLLTGFATIHDQTLRAADGAGQLATGADQAHAGAGTLATGADQLAGGQRRLLDGATRLDGGAGQLADGASTLAGGADTAVGGATQLSTGAGRLAGGLDTLRDRTADLPTQSRKLATGARQVADGNAALTAAGDRVAGASNQLARDVSAGDDGRLAAALRAQGLPPAQVQQALAAVRSVQGTVAQDNQQVQNVNAALGRLGAGSAQVAAGAEQLADSAPALSGGIAQAATGADTLAGGAGQLAGGVHRLADGARDLHQGATTLHQGATELHTGEAQAVTGTDQLAGGAHQLDGGTGRLAGGAHQLHDSLAAGAGQIPNPDPATRQATASTIGDPVAVRDQAQSRAGTYGAGLAPFFMSLATWIGGYVLFLLVRPLSDRATAADQTPLRVALGGWLPAAVLGIAQVTGMYAIVVYGLDIRPEHPWGTYGFLVLASLCFTAIVHALNAALGSVGQFLGLVLMVLQLVSAGGTFPWQTVPGPLYPLHHALPMSYSIDALRHLMYGGALDGLGLDAAMLGGWLALAVLVAARAARRRRVWTPSRVSPELVL